jgi:hypothetical protein
MTDRVQADTHGDLFHRRRQLDRAAAKDGYQPLPEGYQPKIRPGNREPDLSTPPSGGMNIRYPKSIRTPAQAAMIED